MLEVKNLVKIYKPKRGIPVRALNGISLRFPERGMVFLLGKSGSGKSTLLNVLGGLDRCNSGEILIKGRSSRTFRQRHFDSYRNTYLGFIFQEYNILEEFSVGANIALALQLQGKKPTSDQINWILDQVDLAGHGNRKPNELSGGQKQRVAIARALVKSPEIIMADEPTGALDSVTGRQILTTLKKLSQDKLVIVVSHDREFAEQYADRIIELADGQVIRDVERQGQSVDGELQHPVYDADTIHIPEDYVFTEEDGRAITDYIHRNLQSGRELKIRRAQGTVRGFVPTDESRIPATGDGYHLIKSRLPLRYAFSLGGSSLTHKKFRLFMTIVLSCISFTLFGLADTAASYDYVATSVSSLAEPESQVSYASFEISQENEWGYLSNRSFQSEDLENLEDTTGLTLYPVYTFGVSPSNYSISNNLPQTETVYDLYWSTDPHLANFAGWIAGSEALLEDMGAELIAGHLPRPGTNELVISSYMLKTFQDFGYCTYSGSDSIYDSGLFDIEITGDFISTEEMAPNSTPPQSIDSPEDLLGKEICITAFADKDNHSWSFELNFVVCGIVDTGIDYSRYADLGDDIEQDHFIDLLLELALARELEYATSYSLTGLGIVSEDMLQNIYTLATTEPRGSISFSMESDILIPEGSCEVRPMSQLNPQDIVWLDGVERTALADNEIILSAAAYASYVYYNPYGDLPSSPEEPHPMDFYSQYYGPSQDFSAMAGLGAEMYSYDWYGEPLYNGTVTLVGIDPQLHGDSSEFCVFSDSVLEQLGYFDAPEPAAGPMPIAQTLSPMPANRGQIRTLVEMTEGTYTAVDGADTQLMLQNPVSFQLKNLQEIFELLSDIFFWVGIVHLLFACLLFSNFIGTSVAFKKRQIGILRALGSRSNDVFRIFFAESFIIAMINFVLSLAGTIGLSALANFYIRHSAGLLLTVLNVGIRQVALLFGICVIVAFVASFLPVRRIAAKRPIDAIRDR